MQPNFSNNPADWNVLERVTIAEGKPAAAIVGANLNWLIVAGAASRGPVDTPITDTIPRLREIFGLRDLGAGGALVNELWEFNESRTFGQQTWVRVAAAAAVKASFTLETLANGSGTAIVRIDASSVGSWAGIAGAGSVYGVKVKVEAPTDGVSGKWNLRVKHLGQTWLYENLDTRVGTDNTAAVVGDDLATRITITKLADGTPLTVGIAELDADGYITLGQTANLFTSVAGADGTIADTDYTASGRAIDIIAGFKGPGVACIAKRSNATLLAALKIKAAAATDRCFPVWGGTLSQTKAAAISDVATYRADRLIYCTNSPYVLDSETATQIQVPPHANMASCLSQLLPQQHVGSERTKKLHAGVSKLTFPAWSPDDYKDLRAAGICALEKDDDGNFIFVSGVTTDLTVGKTEIARRRCADYIQLSLARGSKPFLKEEYSDALMAEMVGIHDNFLGDLKRTPTMVRDFKIRFGTDTTTTAQRDAGLAIEEVQVKLLGHVLGLVIKTDIYTGTVIATDATF